jgi:hypothetical protein
MVLFGTCFVAAKDVGVCVCAFLLSCYQVPVPGSSLKVEGAKRYSGVKDFFRKHVLVSPTDCPSNKDTV